MSYLKTIKFGDQQYFIRKAAWNIFYVHYVEVVRATVFVIFLAWSEFPQLRKR